MTKLYQMKHRPVGYLSEEFIDHNSEVFDCIRELHDIVWRFIQAEMPEASGSMRDYVPTALYLAESRGAHVAVPEPVANCACCRQHCRDGAARCSRIEG